MPKNRNPKIEFDELQMLFGESYTIDLDNTIGSVTVCVPTIGDIMKIGDRKFYQTLNIFITNTTQYRLQLWEVGIDWNEISDFDLFMLLYKGIDQDVSNLLFKNLNWQDFEPYSKKIDEENNIPILWNEKEQIEINENVYHHFCQFLRTVFGSEPEEKLTNQQMMKEWFINKDKRQLKIEEEKQKMGKSQNGSVMKALISACINHPGFKYKLEELKEVNVCQFYDSVQRLQIYEQKTALLKGMYSGFVDGSKIKSDDYNFMK